eukprot:6458034-Amphidinium_carterae.1
MLLATTNVNSMLAHWRDIAALVVDFHVVVETRLNATEQDALTAALRAGGHSVLWSTPLPVITGAGM